MIKVKVKKQGSYPVSTPKIKRQLREFFEKGGIVSDSEVSVALVGKKDMLSLGKRYLKDPQLHNVLSFTESEVNKKFIYSPGGNIFLGEIIVCYPKAVEEAKKDNMLIEEKVVELIKHGAEHLLGIHHK